MASVEEIFRDAESLPVEERVVLVDSLLRSLNPTVPDIDKLWTKEAKRRLEELRSGRVQGIAGEEVFDRIRKRFEK